MSTNNNLSTRLYLLVYEYYRIGYILTSFNVLEDAKDFAQKAFFEAQQGDIWDFMKQQGITTIIAKYTINGNCVYAGNGCWGLSDGGNSISIHKVDPQTFRLKEFLKERENASYLFDPFDGDDEDEKLTEFVERFDRNVFWAN
jgi:hypothetical protein